MAHDVNPKEMANAPLKSREVPNEVKVPEVKRNRFDVLFTGIIFAAAANDAIYTAERSGLRSKRLASVRVECGGTGGYLPGSIYARQPRGATEARAEFSFSGTMYQPGFVVEDTAVKAELDAWRAGVADSYTRWAAQTGSVGNAPVVQVGVSLGFSL